MLPWLLVHLRPSAPSVASMASLSYRSFSRFTPSTDRQQVLPTKTWHRLCEVSIISSSSNNLLYNNILAARLLGQK